MKLVKLACLLTLSLSTQSAWAAGAGDPFPRDYESSRTRFLGYGKTARQNHRGVETRQIVVGVERLTVDTLFIPGQKTTKNLLVLTSGNHGPEAYAGSALQEIFFRRVLPSLDLSDTGVLLVHALNPWGFKHHRRGTENNVNLNRNFSLSRDLFRTPNEEYDLLRKYLEPRGRVERAGEFPAKDLLLEMILKKEVTRESLTEAIGKGQYTSSQGINFGGQDFEPQTLEIIALLRKVAAPYRNILHIDLHTGLGKKNVLHIMTKKQMNPASRARLNELFGRPGDREMLEVTPPEAEGFYEIHGDYANILAQLFPESDRVIVGITAEFGTVGNGLKGKTVTINRLILENQGHYAGYADERSERKTKERFLELFHPTDPKWREAVLTKGTYLMDTIVKRFLRQNQQVSASSY